MPLFLICSAAYSANYFVYDKPNFISPDAANALMSVENFGDDSADPFKNIHIFTNGLSYWSISSVAPQRHDFLGLNIKAAKEIEQVYLVDGPANIRFTPPENLLDYENKNCMAALKKECQDDAVRLKYEQETEVTKMAYSFYKPCSDEWIAAKCGDCPLIKKECDGHIIGQFEDNKLVLAIREYKGWFFVRDGRNSGWAAKKNLKKIPKNKIYLKKESENPQQFFTDKAEKYEIKVNLEKLQAAVKSGTYNPLDKNLKKYCPQNITPLEKDGIYDYAQRNVTSRKYELYLLCSGLKKPELKEVENVAIKTDKCSCYEMPEYGAPSPKEFTKEEIFYFYTPHDEGERKYQCTLRNSYIDCFVYTSMSAGDYDGIFKICPKDCMTWQNKL